MPKLSMQQQGAAVDAARLAGRLNAAAIAFHENVKKVTAREGSVQLGVQWRDHEAIFAPSFVLETFSGRIIAAYDHVSDGQQMLGRYRFFRMVGDPIKPTPTAFWEILIDEFGSSTWSIPGQIEWSSGNESEVVTFVYRLAFEFYETIERV
ncbi:hypothetical protein [Burkholderia ubonensis]|uniref:hypothetical protein n=1 Tax=Burkholderia ubonensis TaxID=101571 RepID=UPI000AA769FE|nr:hypothetical protein [Burkholderia ubonensis]